MADWPYNTRAWQHLRGRHLSLAPFCEGCDEIGIIKPANTVDHRNPISAGGAPFPGHDGLASYCASCHSEKTVRGVESGAKRTRKPRKGCTADGLPLDRKHPWHSGKQEKSLRAVPPQTTAPSTFELVSLDDGVDDLWV